MGAEKRKFPRYNCSELPVMVGIPHVSLVMLEPDDVSWGGAGGPDQARGRLGAKFRISSLLGKPKAGADVPCTLDVTGEIFPECRASVLWTSLAKEDRALLDFGVQVTVPGDQIDRFETAMAATGK